VTLRLGVLALALALTRALPGGGAGLYLRLAAATAVVLAPGFVLARALGLRSSSATLAWALALATGAAGITFAVHGSLWLALALLLAAGAAALPLARRRERRGRPRGRRRAARPLRGADPGWLAALLAGGALGIALWRLAGPIAGDAPFHLARVRKLDALGSLSLQDVGEFKDGGLHPGYAFPLWHVVLALVARVAGVDPAAVVQHEAAVLAPLALVVTYEAGRELFSARSAGLSVAVASVAQLGLAAGGGGSFPSLALPATASRLLLVPAALTLLFAATRRRSRVALSSVAAAGLALALVHVTYALFVLLPVAGFLLVRALAGGRQALRLAPAAAALAVPALGLSLALLRLVETTRSFDPSAATLASSRHGFSRYPGQIDVASARSFHLAPEVVSRTGAVAVAALLLVPLAGLAGRRRWSAFVLGGSLAVLAAMLVPFLFVHLTDAVSLSQSRRAAGFVPFAFALAGGAAVLVRFLSAALLPLALAAGIALQRFFPGDFGYVLRHGGPQYATWIAAFGGAAALGVVLARRGREPLERQGAVAALSVALFCLPVAVHGFSRWSAPPPDPRALTPGLVAALRRDVPAGGVVFSDVETSYRIAAFAPVYVASSPPAHVADTTANRPYERQRLTRLYFRTGNLAIPRSLGARWLVIARAESRLRPRLPLLYADARFALYRLPAARR